MHRNYVPISGYTYTFRVDKPNKEPDDRSFKSFRISDDQREQEVFKAYEKKWKWYHFGHHRHLDKSCFTSFDRAFALYEESKFMRPSYIELQSAPAYYYYKLILEYEFPKTVGWWRAGVKTNVLRVVYQFPTNGSGCFLPLTFYPVHPNMLKYRKSEYMDKDNFEPDIDHMEDSDIHEEYIDEDDPDILEVYGCLAMPALSMENQHQGGDENDIEM